MPYSGGNLFGDPGGTFADGDGTFGADSDPVPPPPPPPPPLPSPGPSAPPLNPAQFDYPPPSVRFGWAFDHLTRDGKFVQRIHAIDGTGTIDVRTDRDVIRTLSGLRIPRDEFERVEPLTDQLQAYLVTDDGGVWPLGRFLFTDTTTPRTLAEDEPVTIPMHDRTAVMQGARPRTWNVRANTRVLDAVYDLAGEVHLPPDEVEVLAERVRVDEPISAPAGTSRWKCVQLLAKAAACFAYFDQRGVLVFRPPPQTGSGSARDYDRFGVVIGGTVSETDDSWQAPNQYIVIGGDKAGAVGVYNVPAAAPHSIMARGYPVTDVTRVSAITTMGEAHHAARGRYIEDSRTYRTISFSALPDPRHDVFTTIRFDGRDWIETGWSLPLGTGAIMRHQLALLWPEDEG